MTVHVVLLPVVLQLSQLISNIGGVLGLWIGISAVSIFEVAQLFVDLINVVFEKEEEEEDKNEEETHEEVSLDSRLDDDDIVLQDFEEEEFNDPPKTASTYLSMVSTMIFSYIHIESGSLDYIQICLSDEATPLT